MWNNADLKIYCDDPSFLYWAFQYKATMRNYVSDEQPETRTPQRNNRRLKSKWKIEDKCTWEKQP